MDSLLGSLQSALAVAIATTFDDNIYLTGFFSETNRNFRPSHVVAGELIGFTLLIGISLIASQILARSVPVSVTGWLGVLPILIGVYSIVDLFRRPVIRDVEGDDAGAKSAMLHPQADLGFRSARLGWYSLLGDRRSYVVAAIAISNGGNNLAIYIPLLGNSNFSASLLTVLVCYLAVACWLLLSFRLTRLPGVAVVLSRHANRIFPFVLMWLGFRILRDSGVLVSLL